MKFYFMKFILELLVLVLVVNYVYTLDTFFYYFQPILPNNLNESHDYSLFLYNQNCHHHYHCYRDYFDSHLDIRINI